MSLISLIFLDYRFIYKYKFFFFKMESYEFILPNQTPVKKIFDYLEIKLEADTSTYEGGAGSENLNGGTVLTILWEAPKKSYQKVFIVNPHAGRFATVSSEKTNRVTLICLQREILSQTDVGEIQRVLAGL